MARIHLATGRVLLTGASGWLGKNLLSALIHGLPDQEDFRQPQAGLKIRCMAPEQEQDAWLRAQAGVEIVCGNICDPAACEKLCDKAKGALLVHAAGVIHPSRVSDFYRVNVEGTRTLLLAAARAGVARAIIISSNSPCGCNPHPDHLFDEVSPYRPYLNYGRSKMQMEHVVHEIQRAGKLECVILRPSWFYGPHQPLRQTMFFAMIRDGKMPVLGKGDNVRSMAYVDNLCAGIMLASVSAQAAGKTYWIADARAYSMNEIIETVERLLEREFGQRCAHRRLRLPRAVGDLAYLADFTLQSLGVYQQKVHVLSEMNKTIACSVARARRELGYAPQIELEEGMRRSIASLRQSDGRLPF